ncbi:hypothetical protein TNCT_227821 [Trichonephila clavata]|uniref:RNase H type-1 domain-containing protein n=1 Tax=Trichonephila clavata TaxID=2740835 RepID=A0A8X6HHE3_TRICU|nr:hypothetical protein TNCT_227821 [Trichonephila clavata]
MVSNRVSDTWILTERKRSIQLLKDWSSVLDILGQDILLKLAALTQVSFKCFQWLPSHAGIDGNEIAHLLTREVRKHPTHSLFL